MLCSENGMFPEGPLNEAALNERRWRYTWMSGGRERDCLLRYEGVHIPMYWVCGLTKLGEWVHGNHELIPTREPV